MDQVATALVQVESLCQRVGADQDDAVRFGEAFRDTGSFGFRVGAADGEDRGADCGQGLNGGLLAVGVFCVDDHVGAWMIQANQPNFQHQGRQFGIVRRGGLAEADQRLQIGQGRFAGQRRGHFLGFQFGDVFFIGRGQHTEAGHPAAIGAQGTLAFPQRFGAVAIGHHAQGRDAGSDGGHRPFQKADEGQCVGQAGAVTRSLQSGRYQGG